MPAELLKVDKNLQAIKAIEGAWTLPSVPDEVKLDLAGNTMMSPGSLGSLFNGLAADLDEAGRRSPFPTRYDVDPEDAPPPQVSKQTEIGLTVAGLAGFDAPQVYDIRAPQRLKQELADGGYLDISPEDIQSEVWLPEYSFAARQLNFDNMTKRFQGEEPGSLSIDKVFEFVDEWLSPRGLYRAAVELDLWWDVGQITTEFEEWGAKVEAWNEDKFDPRKMIDMLTGPLDDILFPALNLALMFVGVGEVVAVTRGLALGVKGARALAGTYRGAKGLKFAAAAADDVSRSALKGAADIARFSEPSFIARKLGNPAVMEQWRRNSAVILGKKINQQGLRAGFSSNLQQAIDADRGGKSLDHFTDGRVGDRVYETFSNPMFDWGVDLLLFPTNIWNPGTFSKPARASLAVAQRGFRKAAENQDLLIAWDRPVRTFLEELDPSAAASIKIFDNLGVKTPKAAARKYKKLSRSDMGDALAQTFFDGDKESMGTAMGFVAAMAGFDQHARGVADALVGSALHELDSGTRYAFHHARNQLTAQLRIVDPDDVGGLIDHMAKYGDDLTEAVSGSRRSDVYYKNRRKVEEPFFESVENMLERGGKVADGHTRYVGQMDPTTGRIAWKPLAGGELPSVEVGSIRDFDDLAEDAWVEVYHATSPETAERMVEEGVTASQKVPGDNATRLTAEGVYVGDDPDRLRFLFGGKGPEVPGTAVGIRVRKRDLINSPEGTNLYGNVREAAGDPIVGVVIPGDIPASQIRLIDADELAAGVYKPPRVTDDPFFVDVFDGDVRRALGDDADAVLSGAEDLPDVFSRRYLRYNSDGNLRHGRLSEAAGTRQYDPDQLEKLQSWAVHHNDLRAEKMNEIMGAVTPASLEQYVYEVLPTFGRWNEFTESSGMIAQSMLRGELDNVKFVSPMSDANRRLAALPWTPSDVKWTDEMFAMLLELPGDEKLAGSLLESVFSPFARNVDPQLGSFTAAALDTVTKQEALAFGATATRIVRMVQSIRRIKTLPDAERILRITVDHAADVERVSTPGLREALAEAVGAVADTDTVEQLALLARYADEAGVSIDDVERVLVGKLGEINAMPDWADRFMVPTQLDRAGDMVQEVQSKVSELRRQAYYMASEVEGAPQVLTDRLAGDGYKLVYGVEFAQPFDMDGILPHFADAARRHVRKKSLGDFFSRQDPKAVSALKVRKVRESLHATLSGADQTDGRALNFGALPDPGNADQNVVLNDLWEILHEVQEAAGNSLDSLAGAHLAQKVATRASLARIPFDLTRLASDLTFKGFLAKVMGRGYSRAQAQAMYKALQKSQALGFRTHGLYAIESKLRSEPNLLNGLRLLGTTAEGDKIRRLRAGMGAVAGGYVANRTIPEGEDPNSLENLAKRAGGMVLGGVLGGSRLGVPGIRRGVDLLEGTKALKYAYLADYTANIRDMVRFSLSPIFDASRYSEAIILNQLGELPENVKNLRVNQSPSGFRKLVAREARKGGMDAEAATRHAANEWAKVESQFAAAARGYRDFDWEVIDGVGRRFSSVGILGFSPVDWMASTFGHLVKAGAKPKKAYGVVRDIYTYGTTGRSAAELSMNFVFFPFSFTKKTVGHFAKFFSDDLGRLIVAHDLMATYQLLNDNFNLSEEWRDRLPVLDKVHRLNLLAYGIGLGRYAGVNASIGEAGLAALGRIPGFTALEDIPGPSSIVNAFIPQMVPMNQTEDANSAWDTVRGLLPVINDVNTMKDMLIDQAYVIGSEEHLTSQAEQRYAWDEWRTFQGEVEDLLDPAGLTWKQAVRRPEINYLIQRERTKISAKYPAWKQGLGDGIAHATAIDMELKERIQFQKSPGDAYLAQFDEVLNRVEAAAGATFSSSPESMPPEAFRIFRRLAIEFAKESPEFLRLYNRFYRRNLGDITSNVTA